MSEPKPSKPIDTASPLEATQRLPVGMPADPRSSQPEPSHPTGSESSPDATVRMTAGTPPEPTVRLLAGVPVDPRSTQRLDISNIILKQQLADSTVKLPRVEPMTSSHDTQKLMRPVAGEAPIRVQKVDQPAEAAGQTQKLPLQAAEPKTFGWQLSLAIGTVVVLAAAAYWAFSRGPVPQAAVIPQSGESAPTPVGPQAYLEKAKAGDAHAMRMLAVMYYYGLDVPQDREKGLYWYRKAAENGSEAARSELSKIEGGR